jgi:hypothetical protein
MSLWHAEIDKPNFVDGAKVTLLSGHRVVRVVTADTLSIETPTGHKFSGVVEDRTGSNIRLILVEGQPISLEMVIDESIHPPTASNNVFSRQVWMTH